MDLVLLPVGVVLLYLGGEGLVRGGVGIGRRFGLSPMVVGLTIVSCGTSSPELAASLAAVLEGRPLIAVGNVVGSNIANLGLVLGLTALIWPLSSGAGFPRRDTVVMLSASIGLLVLLRDGWITRAEGIALLFAMAAYIGHLLARPEESKERARELETGVVRVRGGIGKALAAVVVGSGLLVLGAHLLVVGAVAVAAWLGISEKVVGLTLVAFGTSLPELAASVVAAIRHHSDIVIGNLLGSNVFNILFILGSTAAVHEIEAPWLDLRGDLLVMLFIGALAPLLLLTGARLSRWEGGLLLLCYGLWVGLLFR